jgi:hypothetical protein
VKIDSVDAFVKAKVQPEHREVVGAIRAVMRGRALKVTEEFSYRMPVWKAGGIVAYLSAGKKAVTLGFVRGNRFEDKYALLKGRGKSSRHLKFRSADDVKKSVLVYYVRQALKLNKE